MASTRGGHDACESTALTPILPLELIQKITVLAARTHPWTKIPLALSCRDICNWTAQARWHTIIVLNEAQARSLLECVRRHYPLPDDDVQRSPLHGAGSKKAQPLKEDAISLPASLSGCVKALFLHVMPTKPRNADLAMECAEEILRCGSIAGELDVLDIWRFGYEDGRQDSGDRYLVYMPRELTITYVLAAAYPDWPSFYQWHGDGTRLKRLHVIGADFEEPGGITMPYDGLARLRKGSISSSDAGLRYKADVVNDGWLAGRDDAVAAASGRPEPIELTHIRYDTARFSFKPPEIVAALLRGARTAGDQERTSSGGGAGTKRAWCRWFQKAALGLGSNVERRRGQRILCAAPVPLEINIRAQCGVTN
ncbi:hypothetical protein IE81DRAFT_228329 [Ceraceosorus guamensis]|uniref:Uncharacterized protein n=1 Tax=Ceraceosorus guamensis TaxID=1522189 RepID=A0A316W5E4_9BASI|nr:hypothetical protein IE81DRAFT_228329 [Ceraceosorus guamensis]PWN45077.1 hypothetical protein IE81DRAFT_228329 [Ceraceosorus guamensis]